MCEDEESNRFNTKAKWRQQNEAKQKKNLHTISYKQRTTNESQHTKKKTAVNDFF